MQLETLPSHSPISFRGTTPDDTTPFFTHSQVLTNCAVSRQARLLASMLMRVNAPAPTTSRHVS